MKVYITAPLAHRFQPETRDEFIKIVNSIDSLLKEFKLSTYLTYRDFLRWGKVTYKPSTVYQKIDLELKTSDLFIAIHPNEGLSANITLGMAAALRKYIIIVLDKHFELDSLPGLMYQGFNEITKCEIIVYNDMQDLHKKLRKAIKTFLKSRR